MTGLEAYTLFHVVLSLIGIGSGFVVLAEFLGSKNLGGWNMLFLTTTAATSVTGFLFPFHGFLPSYGVGIVSIIILSVAIAALSGRHLAGPWRSTYVISAMIAFYLNVFVLVIQLFEKVPTLRDIAPTQSEPPFVITQLVVLIAFAVATVFAVRRFHSPGLRTV